MNVTMHELPIYLDYNATTPCDPAVAAEMLPFFTRQFGNAASRNHAYGWMAEEAVAKARKQVAGLIGAEDKEIVFTSGATESDNLALKGIMALYARKGKHLITAKTEHKAVLDTCYHLEKSGYEVTYLETGADGLLNPETLEDAIRPDTVLVSVMWANNETGVIQPMAEIGEICARHGVLLMSDATQAVGKIPVDPRACGVHLMAFSAHKMYGPKGVGGLYVSRKSPRVRLAIQQHGGGHEDGLRSGTLNVPGIVGFGKAAELALAGLETEAQRLGALRDRFESTLLGQLDELYINGAKDRRLPHVSNLSFRYLDSEAILGALNRKIAAATGSACSSATLEPSHVLLAMGQSEEQARSAIRFSFGRFSTVEEAEKAAEWLIEAVKRLREKSPVWELFKEGLI